MFSGYWMLRVERAILPQVGFFSIKLRVSSALYFLHVIHDNHYHV